MGRLNYTDTAALAVPTKAATDSSTAAASTAFVQSVVPAGVVMPYAGTVAPANWLMADGSLVSRTTYSALFSAIGTTYGAGDGSTTFKLPDLRGIFIRGLDNGAGVDSGRTLGSSQADAMQGHYHSTLKVQSGTGSTNNALTSTTVGTSGFVPIVGSIVTDPTSDGSHGTPRTASETRPTNVALNHIIKAY